MIRLSVELSSASPLQCDSSGSPPCLSDPVESLSEDTAFLEVLEVYFDFRLQDKGGVFYRESMKSPCLDIFKGMGAFIIKATTSNLDCILDVNVKVGHGSSPEV